MHRVDYWAEAFTQLRSHSVDREVARAQVGLYRRAARHRHVDSSEQAAGFHGHAVGLALFIQREGVSSKSAGKSGRRPPGIVFHGQVQVEGPAAQGGVTQEAADDPDPPRDLAPDRLQEGQQG